MSRAETFYAAAPIWVQQAMVTAKGASFRFRRGNDTVIKLELQRLLASDYVTNEVRLRRLNVALRRFLADAVATTPYYQELVAAGDYPPIWEDPACLDHISELPLLEKSAVRGNETAFYSSSVAGQRINVGHTSGTTGTPMNTRETVVSFSRRWAFVARLRHWAGVPNPLHPRRLQWTGRNLAQESAPYWRLNAADNSLLMSTVNIGPATVAEYLEAMRRYRPTLMEGYPSAMTSVAKVAVSQGLEIPQVPATITTAETLTKEMRQDLESAFGTKVFNQYAASEPSCFWSDCEFGTLHVHQEYGVSEILNPDGRPALPGELGEVVVTSTLNPAMPLIRYRTGDVARAAKDQSCECGRDLPVIQEVIGRMDDILYTPSRGYVGRLDPVFKGLHGIIESQIVQESPTRIRVLLVPDARYTSEIESALIHNLQQKLGPDQNITVEQVQAIPRGPNGKFRAVVTKVGSRASSSQPEAL